MIDTVLKVTCDRCRESTTLDPAAANIPSGWVGVDIIQEDRDVLQTHLCEACAALTFPFILAAPSTTEASEQ